MIEEKITQSEKKRQAIMKASVSIFAEHGFDGAKMDDIAEKADVSKQTIYSHFGSKENLFKSTLLDLCDDYGKLFERNATLYDDDPERALRESMLVIIPGVCSPEMVSIKRLIIAETFRQPDLFGLYEEMMEAHYSRMSKFMEKMHSRGIIDAPDGMRAALDLMSLCKGHVYLTSIISSKPVFTQKEICAHVKHGLDAFFKLYKKD